MQYEISIAVPSSSHRAYWAEEAQRIHWDKPFTAPPHLDYSRAPFARWFIGGTTNLCFNAVDRHLGERGKQAALIAISTETNSERVYDLPSCIAKCRPWRPACCRWACGAATAC
jgi:propionyl-CoA synthetase